jgi:predicted GTPase
MEINEYLRMHPEVDSYCVIGDTYSELELHENNLILTTWDTDGLGNGGLLPKHQEEIKKILSKKRK